MTTAHRPTFDPARGKEAGRGEAYHQRLLPAHKTLKFRQQAQGAPSEQAKRDLKAELLKAERAHFSKKDGQALPDEEEGDDQGTATQAKGAIEADGSHKRKLDDHAPPEEEDYEAKKRRVLEVTRDIDADSSGSDSDDNSDSDEESEEEDESAELMRELAKIKAERAAAAAAQAEKEAQKAAEQREKDIALGNPLLNNEQGRGNYGVKRRWDDDVVFKNQARGTEEKGKEKRFVNDLLRSDFHRRFMDKYVR
jgi:protein CWC15